VLCASAVGFLLPSISEHARRGRQQAVRAARYVRNLWPEMSFVAAMASFEIGRKQESIADFLHGACNHPGAAQLIAGRRAKAPRTGDEARDHRVGAALLQNLTPYLARRGSRARRFFGPLTAHPRFGALMREIDETRNRRDQERRTNARVAWDLLRRMESPEFAAERAAEIRHLLRPGKTAYQGHG